MCSTGSTLSAGSLKDSLWYEGSSSAATPISVPQRSNLTCLRARFTLLRRADHLTEAHQADRPTLIPVSAPRENDYEADDPDQANQAHRFADLSPPARYPIVDTIIAWGEQILAYHTTRRRVSNGPIEGINNLLQVLRRVAHGFTNYDNYAAEESS